MKFSGGNLQDNLETQIKTNIACLLSPKTGTAAGFISVMSVYTSGVQSATPLNNSVIANGVVPIKDTEKLEK